MSPPDSFTLAEARAVLARIRGALTSLQQVQQQLRAVSEELRALNRRHLNDGVVAEQRVRTLRQEQQALGEDARLHAFTIRDAGVELKSIDDGLLDFPTEIGGEPAYWCWRTGEEDIGWWHPQSTGFAGRQPIPPSA